MKQTIYKRLVKTYKGINNIYSKYQEYLPYINSPFSLKIRITQKCNMSCPYCFLKDSLNKPEHGHLTSDEWEKVFTELPPWTGIDITGAEPFVAKDFEKFLSTLNRFSFKKSITTNGFNISEEKVHWLFKYKINYLMVSVDGTESLHDKSRDKQGSFQKTIEFLDRVFELKKEYKTNYPIVNIKFTIHDDNHMGLNPLVELLQSKYQNDFIFTVNLLYQNKSLALEHLYEDTNKLLSNGGNYAQYTQKKEVKESLEKVLSNKDLNLTFSPQMKSKEDLFAYIDKPAESYVKSCHLYKNNLTLYYNGDILPCFLSYKIGNIRDYNLSLKDVYKGKEFLQFRNEFKLPSKACQGCCAGTHQS